MDPVAFTCLLPVHGSDDAGHFREAGRSLEQASVAPAEVLIGQDGDLPPALAAAVADCARTLGARVVQNPGAMGLHHNLNHALTLVRTPWVARCDADDVNAPHRFEAQTRFLRDHADVGVLGGDLIEFWPDGRERRKTMPLDHDAIVALARWRSPVNHNTVFYRTDAVLSAGGYPELPFKEDYGLWLRLIGRGVRFANLRDDLVRARLGFSFYRRRAGLKNLRSEWEIYKVRREIAGLGGTAAAVALVARSAALCLDGPAQLVYEWGLRRSDDDDPWRKLTARAPTGTRRTRR